MPTLKTLDIMIFELIDPRGPVEMFVAGPEIIPCGNLFRALCLMMPVHLHFFVICMDMRSESIR